MRQSHKAPFLRRRAFTLIELVVVIAVVSVLAGLLFPVFARAREKARQATCASNLRQIGVATFLYAQDNDDLFPYAGDPSDIYTSGWAGTPWASAAPSLPLVRTTLDPYVKEDRVWDCPDDAGYGMAGTFEAVPMLAFPTAFGKYGMSYETDTYLAFLHERLSGVAAWDKRQPSTQYGPDHVILMQDMDGSWHGGQAYADKCYNVLFCDGHLHYTTRAEDTQLWQQTFTPPAPQ